MKPDTLVSRMNVAYLVNQYPSVSHTFVRREIRALEEQGLEVQRYSVRDTQGASVHGEDQAEYEMTRAILGPGYLLRLIGLTTLVALRSPTQFVRAAAMAVRMGWKAPCGLFKHAAYLAEACVLSTWLGKSDAGILHAHFGTNSTTVAALCHVLGGPPFSFTVHGPEEFDHPTEWSLAEKARHAKYVFAVSSFGRSQLFRWLDATDWPKVQVVRCGVETADFEVVPVPDTNELLCIGRICEQKGHGVLIQALASLRDRGIPFRMTLAGDGPMRRQIESQIRASDLQDCVTVTGWVDGKQVRELLQSSRGMVLPSFAEGLPVVLMEAMASGRPVISTFIAGIPELVEDQRHGWLVPAGNAEALANAIQALLATPIARLEEISRENRHQVRRYHDIHEISHTIAELFRTETPGSFRTGASQTWESPPSAEVSVGSA